MCSRLNKSTGPQASSRLGVDGGLNNARRTGPTWTLMTRCFSAFRGALAVWAPAPLQLDGNRERTRVRALAGHVTDRLPTNAR